MEDRRLNVPSCGMSERIEVSKVEINKKTSCDRHVGKEKTNTLMKKKTRTMKVNRGRERKWESEEDVVVEKFCNPEIFTCLQEHE